MYRNETFTTPSTRVAPLPGRVLAGTIAITAVFGFLTACAPKKAATENTSAPAAGKTLRIASMAPSYTAVLADLGLADWIVACDTWSETGGGLSDAVVRFDMMNPDAERLAAIAPDLILVSEMTKQGTSTDPFKPLSDSGIRVEYLPTSASLAEIRSDTARIAALVGREAEGQRLIATMDDAIAAIRSIGEKIPANERRTVFFELSPAPYLYSFGSGVYLDELIAVIGADNALGASTGWLSVGAETVVAADPDVILTNVIYAGDPVPEILGRPGWEGVKAVRNRRVYYIDNDSSSQPCPRIAKALGEMARAVYPERYR